MSHLTVGSLTFLGEDRTHELPFPVLVTEKSQGVKEVFFMAETDITSSREVVELVSRYAGTVIRQDVSIDTEDVVWPISSHSIRSGGHRVIEFDDGKKMAEVLKLAQEIPGAVAVREAWMSREFPDARIITVDVVSLEV